MSAQKFHRMKQKITGSLIGCALALLAPQIVQAQGTMNVVSNLDQVSAGSLAVGSNSWLALTFTTGNDPNGFLLDSIQLGMTGATANPTNFTVAVYSQGAFPNALSFGSSLGTLNGSLNPVAGGVYTYTPASTLFLSPNTDFVIELTAGTAVANGAYDWSYTSSKTLNNSNGWGVEGLFTSSDGSIWHYNLSDITPLFAINVTDAPEPGVLSLFGLGGLAFLWHLRKSKEQ
jgi:hypothetical protein